MAESSLLSEEQVETFWKDGFVLVPNLLSKHEAQVEHLLCVLAYTHMLVHNEEHIALSLRTILHGLGHV